MAVKMPTAVTIDASAAVQNRAGVARYCEELALALRRVAPDLPVTLFTVDQGRRSFTGALSQLPRRNVRWGNKRWRMTCLASWLLRLRQDHVVGPGQLFHATDLILPRVSARTVFTLLDLSYLRVPETHLASNRWFLRIAVPLMARRANAVVCISEFTKREAVSAYGPDLQGATVIPLGVEPRFSRASVDSVREAATRLGLPSEYILFVGTLEPRKNLERLFEAYQIVRARGRQERLVLVGRRGWLYQEALSRLRSLGLEQEVIFTGYVPKEDLPAVYSGASALVFPSLYEGFGLPPLEAMACGTPVVCSETTSLPEVVGDAAVSVNPASTAQIAEGILRVLNDEDLSRCLSARGLARASRFTWEETARRTAAVYRTVLRCC